MMDEIADVASEIFDLATLLSVTMAGPDAETAMDGMHRVVLEIRKKAEHLKAPTQTFRINCAPADFQSAGAGYERELRMPVTIAAAQTPIAPTNSHPALGFRNKTSNVSRIKNPTNAIEINFHSVVIGPLRR